MELKIHGRRACELKNISIAGGPNRPRNDSRIDQPGEDEGEISLIHKAHQMRPVKKLLTKK